MQMEKIKLPPSRGSFLNFTGRVAGKLVITEKTTHHGKSITFFGSMHHATIRPRKNIHMWNQRMLHGGQNYYGSYPLPVVDNYFNQHIPNTEEKPKQEKNESNQTTTKATKVFNDFCGRSSLHGLQYLDTTAFNIYERLFWLISFLTATAFATYFITSIYQKFNRSPVIVSFNPTLTGLDQIPFPAITICNVNIATKVNAERILKFGSEVDKRLLDDMCNLNNSFTNESTADATADWRTVRAFILSVNQKCSDMFKVCKWENRPISCDDYINSILTDEGYCCSFNRLPSNYSLRDVIPGDLNETYPGKNVDWNPEDGYPPGVGSNVYPVKASGSGVHLGLTLTLDPDIDQYYCTSTSSTGYKVILSNPIETPKVADFGFLLSPGMEARIPIQPTIIEASSGIKSINVDKRQCFFARERKLQFYRIYTERNCKLECQAIYTLNKCGCVPYFLPKNVSTKVCDKRTEQCADDAKFAIERLTTPERRACNCLPGCFEISYSRKTMTEARLSTKYRIADEDLLQNDSLEHFAGNMVVAHFFYESDRFKVEMKSELYGFSEFLSNTGGLLGVFLGFSFLSAVEFFFYLVLKPFCSLRRGHNDIKSDKNSLPYVN